MSSLYLSKEKYLQILLDGPALVVRCKDQADRLFPLQRLQRVFLHASLDVSSKVILGCARAGVTLCFTDARSHPLMWCLGQPVGDGSLAEALNHFQQHDNWETLFSHWQKRQQRQLVEQLVNYFNLDQNTQHAELTGHISRYAIRYTNEHCADNSSQWLSTEINALLITQLSVQQVAEESSLLWAQTLTPLLQLQMQGARIRWLGHRFAHYYNRGERIPDLTHKEFIHFFEEKHDALNHAATQMLNALSLWIQHPEEEE